MPWDKQFLQIKWELSELITDTGVSLERAAFTCDFLILPLDFDEFCFLVFVVLLLGLCDRVEHSLSVGKFIKFCLSLVVVAATYKDYLLFLLLVFPLYANSGKNESSGVDRVCTL